METWGRSKPDHLKLNNHFLIQGLFYKLAAAATEFILDFSFFDKTPLYIIFQTKDQPQPMLESENQIEIDVRNSCTCHLVPWYLALHQVGSKTDYMWKMIKHLSSDGRLRTNCYGTALCQVWQMTVSCHTDTLNRCDLFICHRLCGIISSDSLSGY